jgi:hypothetical protein
MNIVTELLKADNHTGGLKTLFVEKPDNFLLIKQECLDIYQNYKPSDVTDKNHRTYWTNPYGEAKQWSLWNDSGLFDENASISSTPESIKSKKFHHGDRFPYLKNFLNLWPDKLNARLNLLSPGSGLGQHEEQIQQVWGEHNSIRIRFHLPIITNNKCLVFLDGEWFHFEEEKIYFFNNGCVHAAQNNSEIERLHLVWDCLLTKEILKKLENGISVPSKYFEPVKADYATYNRKCNFAEKDIHILEGL